VKGFPLTDIAMGLSWSCGLDNAEAIFFKSPNRLLLRIHFTQFGCQAVSHLQPRNERDKNSQSFSDYTSQYNWKKGNRLGNGVSSLFIP